jgi:hypothetical protein
MTLRTVLLAVTLLAALLAPRPAAAETQTFSDRAAFSAAAGAGLGCVDFEELEDWSFFDVLTYPGLEVGSHLGSPTDLLVLSPDSFSDPALTSRVVLANRDFGPVILTFDAGVNAVGLDVLTLDPSGSQPSVGVVVTVESSTGAQSFPIPLASGGPAFFGIITPGETISRVTVENTPGQERYVGVDNICSGTAADGEPEPDLLQQRLSDLLAAIAAGRADGTIRQVGPALKAKARAARKQAAAYRRKAAAGSLRALIKQTRAQRGKKIAAGRADQLIALANECLSLLQP